MHLCPVTNERASRKQQASNLVPPSIPLAQIWRCRDPRPVEQVQADLVAIIRSRTNSPNTFELSPQVLLVILSFQVTLRRIHRRGALYIVASCQNSE